MTRNPFNILFYFYSKDLSYVMPFKPIGTLDINQLILQYKSKKSKSSQRRKKHVIPVLTIA